MCSDAAQDATPPSLLSVRHLGLVPYDQAAVLQARLVEQRRLGQIGNTLLLLQHPAVITLGVRVRNDRSHILASLDELAARGIPVCESGRGGDVTYHGPGQLVGYPILDLSPDRRDLHRYVRDLEEVLIRALRLFDIDGRRLAGLTGVWVAMSANLDHFRLIVPCGISDRGVTSIERLLGAPVPMAAVETAVTQSFAEVFGLRLPRD
jgi:lipoate-protein ligase B